MAKWAFRAISTMRLLRESLAIVCVFLSDIEVTVHIEVVEYDSSAVSNRASPKFGGKSLRIGALLEFIPQMPRFGNCLFTIIICEASIPLCIQARNCGVICVILFFFSHHARKSKKCRRRISPCLHAAKSCCCRQCHVLRFDCLS